jgi:uncharacterized membrane protein YedE/YeeE
MLFEWGLASMLRPACHAAGGWLGLGWAGLSLAACAAAALIARPLARDTDPASSRPWLARLAMIGAGIFALAISLQTLAILIVPSCVR